ncbi:MAG: hypothetical protein F4Y08_11725 [Caldilineaceae bacterium SB0662_bin_9]|uniref:Uncharacterized protein n=1 Tax=Caldilineaceae bacterium SB0662_bin_9 TaxID=2605258 RepID=A0A6B1DWE6_9CHLR|nr:hypothetical protein [Caldilineaceae bacterium SB0662_bin_9]
MPHPGPYQTRVSAYGELYGRVERKLFAEVAADRSAVSLKREYLQRYGIPARLFNAVRVSLEGRMVSVKAQQELRLDSVDRRLARAERRIRSTNRSVGGRPCGRSMRRCRRT